MIARLRVNQKRLMHTINTAYSSDRAGRGLVLARINKRAYKDLQEGRGFTGCGKRPSALLSVAKHLQYLFENKQMQILRSAQDDSPVGFFRSLLGCPN